MEDLLPFRAEYAKTGRAGCKGCKTNIGQGSLRIAVMVQSAFHDGKQPNWFHQSCFFKKQRPKSVGDIAHFENLKYEDQKEIKLKIESSTDIVVATKSEGKGKGKKRPPPSDALKDFGIEYAKSGRAECRGCQQKILKDEIRIKKVVYDTEVGMKYGGQPLWHHVDCFEKIRDDLNYYGSGDMLPGFNSLKKEDKELVKKAIQAKTDIPVVKKLKGEPKDEEEVKKELDDENKMIKQNKDFFNWKKKLQELKKQELVDLLLENDQNIPAGVDLLTEACADILTFGALGKCNKCEGHFILGKNNYVCNGNLDEWTKCLTTLNEPPRLKTQIPSELKDYSFLKKYRSKPCTRLFMFAAPTTSLSFVKKEEENGGPRVQRDRPKLYNMEFVIIGDTEEDKNIIKETVKKLGGSIKTKLHTAVAAVISTEAEVKRMGSRMQDCKTFGIHVVKEDFLKKVLEANDTLALLEKESICDWGVDPATRIPVEEERKKKSIYSKSSKSSKVTLKLKGGGAVDPDSHLEDVAHIYEDKGVKYNAILTLTDIQAGKNSYYKIQLLKSDNGNRYWLFRSWGRIGTTIGNTKLVDHSDLHSARQDFEALYLEKTKNHFGSKDFRKVPGSYVAVDVDYSDNTNSLAKQVSTVPSKLEGPVQDLIQLLFDVDMMKKVMLEFELDTEKMPLGKLSKTQLERAYSTLNDLSKLIERGASQNEFIGASNKFYTLVPHDFGINQPTLLDTNEIIKTKIEMLDSLMEIELAYSMLNDKNIDDEVHPLDAHYGQLKTDMEVLDHKGSEFKLLTDYVKNTHAETHKMYELEVVNIFKVNRQGEDKRYKPFKKLHNRKLLWHGSRLTNWVGIMSHGLKIAPPEAPCTGYMFGKGIYFADMVSKSANYCFTSKTQNTGLLMLCEVALGDMVEYENAHYVTKLPKNKHSTKGVGKTQPHPSESVKREDGVEIPLGRPHSDDKIKSSLLYNEYIVYDVAQVKCQYLFKMNFHYKY